MASLMRVFPQLLQEICALLLMAMLLAASTANPALALGGGTKEKLKAGGYVIFMRNAQMRPQHLPSSDIKDCLPQHEPPDANGMDVIQTSERFKKSGIKITKALASRACQDIETAKLMAPSATVETREELAVRLTQMDRNARRQIVNKIRREIAEWKGPGNLLVVSHKSPLKEISGRSLLPGGYIVVDPRTLKIIAEDN